MKLGIIDQLPSKLHPKWNAKISTDQLQFLWKTSELNPHTSTVRGNHSIDRVTMIITI